MSKISELSDGGSLQSTDYLIAVRSGGNVKVQADGNLSLGALTLTGLTVDTNTLHVDATNNRVGVGTTSPNVPLDVTGTINATTGFALTGNAAQVTTTYSGITTSRFYTSTSGLNLAVDGAWPLIFSNNSTERMRITSAGNVGIGVSSPTAKLHILADTPVLMNNAAGTSEGKFDFVDSGATLRMHNFFGTGSNITFLTNPNGGAVAERMRIDSAGNVGIGTSSPAVQLHLQDGASEDVSGSTIRMDLSGINPYWEIQARNGGNSANRKLHFYTNSGSDEVLTLTQAGNVGIGTTSPGYKLDVNGTLKGAGLVSAHSGATEAQVQFVNSGRTIYHFLSADGSLSGTYDATGSKFIENYDYTNNVKKWYTSGSERMRLDSNGNLLVGTTSSSGSSSNTQKVIGGNFATFSGGATIPASSTATILTLPTNKAGMYLIAGQFGVQNNDIYGSMMIVVANGTDFRVALNNSGSSATLSMSGANVQIANALGVPLDATATATFIGA